ncbi:hypothetical protein ONZ51_g3814 [Trametes cubensis]|uniref:Uncharacterized protein n=1 Tax=Trametes cubensis TaxID=1111947 RepID=A0AAD7TZE5_9APHY|nr:hypothetical protein ONZ51_g3814 [Trametes cubensis]
MMGLGYFAFPPPGSQSPNQVSDEPSRDPHHDLRQHSGPHDVDPAATCRTSESVEQEPRTAQRGHTGRQEPVDARKRQRLEKERELALESEIEYVRMGLSIRDRFGRVDKARMERVRAEILLRDTSAKLVKQWETYETRWRNLLASSTPVTFVDIPWPLSNLPSSVDDLCPEAIIQFFLNSLQLPGNTSTEPDRLRSALLRWHPDKMAAVLSRTVDVELDSVREGVNIVFRALHARLNLVRCSQQNSRTCGP